MTEVDSPISIISSATYRGVTSPGAIASGFGHSLGTGPQSSSIPVPTLFGTTATLTDSSMAVRQVLMYYASPSQLNFVVPSAAALGTALLSVTSSNGKVSTGQIQIANVAPGLYAADGSGSGPPAGFAAESSAPSQLNALFQCDPASGRCITQPLDVPTDGSALYLILFGTVSSVMQAAPPRLPEVSAWEFRIPAHSLSFPGWIRSTFEFQTDSSREEPWISRLWSTAYPPTRSK